MKKIEIFLLGLILFFAFVVRLYGFSNPIADWHSWRQADTSAVSRNFVKFGFDMLHPRFDDLSNVGSGKDNPMGYRYVEFPLYNLVQAGLFVTFKTLSIEQWGRVVTILSHLLSIIFLYGLLRRYRSSTAGLFAAFFFAFLPYNIFYGRTILPDASMVMAVLGGIYFFDTWAKASQHLTSGQKKPNRELKNIVLYLISVLFMAAALLIKPYAIFFMLPLVYIIWYRFGIHAWKKWELWVLPFIVFTPLLWWRHWMLQYPEGIPANSWLYNKDNIRFKGAFFYYLFGNRIGEIILGYWGLAFFSIGVLAATIKKNTGITHSLFFFSFLVSSLLYMTVFAGGNVQHDYYQILIIPSIVIFLALGCEFLFSKANVLFSKSVSFIFFFISLSFMLSFGWYYIRDYFNINNPNIVIAGKAVDALIPKNAKVLAPYNGDTSFLYQTKRQGWASFQKSLEEMIVDLGAEYLVLVSPVEKDFEIGNKFFIVASTPQYILFDLRKKP